jgi:enolase
MSAIQSVVARELVDARGRPAVEVEVVTESGATGRGLVATASPTGVEPGAVRGVDTHLGPAVQGMDALDQPGIDRVLVGAAGSAGASRVGHDAMLAVSLAIARAAAESVELPLWRYLGGAGARVLPTPLVAAPAGTAGGVRVLVVPRGAASFSEALRLAASVVRHMEEPSPSARGASAAANVAIALAHAVKAIETAGARPGEEVALALDGRGDELLNVESGRYRWTGGDVSVAELVASFEDCCRRFPLAAFLRPCAAGDAAGWAALAQRVPSSLQLVADLGAVGDVLPTAASAVLISPSRLGTVSDSLEAVRTARVDGLRPIVAHDGGDTEDTFLADLAVASHAGQILAGAFSEGAGRYNQLARIAWALGDGAIY